MTACHGCRQRVYRLADGLHDALADGGGLHFCADVSKRETVTMSQEQYSLRCSGCGTREVAESSWGRLVDFPDSVWMSPKLWQQLRQHVCERPRKPTKPAPIWEAFGA